mmetsp:Transcript_8507/g.9133  ORF Transcript_8507/g.9133 Transcript_8507/m.9133 type:complete len:564 (+) Transcript_8507:46-1737(+)
MTEQDQQNAASDNNWKQKKNWTAILFLAIVGFIHLYAVILHSNNFRWFSASSSSVVGLWNNLVYAGVDDNHAAATASVCTTTTGSKTKTTTPTPSKKVYVYQEEVFHQRAELEYCDPGGLGNRTKAFNAYLSDVLLEQLTSGQSHHLIVTDNPEEADWFYVPFNVDRSQQEHVKTCGQNHVVRLGNVLDALERSVSYQRYKGADHVWYLGGWELTTAAIGRLHYFPTRRELIHNMAILRYCDRKVHLPGTQPRDDYQKMIATAVSESEQPSSSESEQDDRRKSSPEVFEILADVRALRPWWRQGQDHRCTVNVPYRYQPAIAQHHPHIARHQQTLEEWVAARPYQFHFVGTGDFEYHPGQAQGVQTLNRIWHETAKQLPSSTVFNVDTPLSPEDFAESLVKSQFCLMIRGDDPARSRFFDAISAGCIPLIISDGFRPFGVGYDRMRRNYDAFTLSIPESHWLEHAASALMLAVTMPRNELRFMHHSLMAVRPQLVFHMEDDGRSSQVVESIFQSLNERCLLDSEELVQDYNQFSKLLPVGMRAPKLSDLMRLAGVHKQAAPAA